MKIDHVAVVVKNIDEALKTYRDAFGLALARVEDVPAEGVKIAFLPFADGNSELELLEPTRADTGVAKFLAKRGEGLHHLCLEVANIEATAANLAANGLDVLEDEPRVGSNGQKYLFVHPKSAHGVLIELYQKPGK